jgi:hypothetical protein
MSEPTTTLQQLRRAICKELEMPFFKRYKNGFLDADSGSTTELVDADLTQKDKFWTGSWVYRVASQEASPITNFLTADNKLTLEVPITAFANGDDYEIHSIWNAYDIHEAINQAIRDSRRIFLETITDESLIVQEDKLTYSLSSLSKTPHIIRKVWLEQPSSVQRGTIISATTNTFTVPAGILPNSLVDTWYVSIYAGTGAGQLRQLVAVNPTQGSVANWDTIPDSTSKYALWNASDEIQDWTPWHNVRFDSSKEFPDYLYFTTRPLDFQGLRIRLEYTAYASELSNENDTTIVPISYLMPAAISILHGRRIKDTKTDRELHFGESRRYQEKADNWLVRNAPHHPDMNVLNQHPTGYVPTDPADPLNWG